MYFEQFNSFKKSLGQIQTWFDAAEAHAKAKSFDPNVLLAARLSPDQFAFTRQVQIACDTVKLGCSRLTGKEAPTQADTETTFDELRARIKSVIAYVESVTSKDFEGAGARSITQPRWEGKTMTGHDYFYEHVIPNFYFHTAHTYAILRHNGVSVGKKDYLGQLTMKAPV
jgi:uncharacterized protein